MDSKRKYLRNRHWKGKYHPRNATIAIKQPLHRESNLVNGSENSELATELKQPIPKEGWFPKYDSSASDFEDFESLKNFSSLTSASNFKTQIKNDNWFDKELDDIQLNLKDSTNKINVEESEKGLKSISQEFIKTAHQFFNCKDKNHITKKYIEKGKSSKVDSEEEELEFLLSLKEPVYKGPLITKKKYENEKRLTDLNNKYRQQKPIKSIDLEKWLDSVLDD